MAILAIMARRGRAIIVMRRREWASASLTLLFLVFLGAPLYYYLADYCFLAKIFIYFYSPYL